MDPEAGSGLGTKLILLFCLTMVNAFFAAAEMAMISIDRIKLEKKAEDGNKAAQLIMDLTREQSKFLSTIQVGITFANLLSAGLAATNISVYLVKPLENLGIGYADSLAMIIVTVILSFFTLVFGELVPKRVALTKSEAFAMFAVRIIHVFAIITKPFVILLTLTTNLVLKILGIDLEGVEEKVTLEDLKSIVTVGQEQGVINPIEKGMIDSIIGFDDKLAEEIMTARTEVFMIDINDPIEEYLNDLMEMQFSRIPVYEDSVDNIIGILYVKDLLKAALEVDIDKVNIREILRPAYFVPERKNVNDLFLDLKESRNHIAILIDEYGGFSGIVTMEDLLEEIVGEIDDEYDHDEPEICQIDEHTSIVRGSVSIKDINLRLNLELDEESEDYDSVGGLIISCLGYIPEAGDSSSVEVEGVKFTIMEVEDNRIQKAKVEVPENYEEIKKQFKNEDEWE